jgi:hypothetical protein
MTESEDILGVFSLKDEFNEKYKDLIETPITHTFDLIKYGVKVSEKDTLQFTYYTTSDTPLYPVRNLIFLNQEGTQRDLDDIPEGYRNFHQNVGDHSGGVFVLHRELFYKMNGLNPYYKGWGKEDDDTRDRLRLLGYNWKRNEEGLFYGLYHIHNYPEHDDVDFINNHILLSQLKNNLHLGYKNVSADIKEFKTDNNNIKWLKIKNFKYE